MKRMIPDLRDTPEITLEHCSVLLEKIEEALNMMEELEGFAQAFVQEIDSNVLLDHYEEHFEVDRFARLFRTEFGKGVLVGSFVQRLFDKIAIDMAEGEEDAAQEG